MTGPNVGLAHSDIKRVASAAFGGDHERIKTIGMRAHDSCCRERKLLTSASNFHIAIVALTPSMATAWLISHGYCLNKLQSSIDLARQSRERNEGL